jgi:hypothetical protein
MTAAGEELSRALHRHFASFAGALGVEEPVSRSWASITFSGERHRLRLSLGGAGAAAAGDAFLDGLAEREFALRGHILADIALVGDEREGDTVRLTLEALTVEAS